MRCGSFVRGTRLGSASRGGPTAARARCRNSGEAALAMVLGITLLLTTGGAILASTAIQHDPLVQNDVVQHFAYRALEAGSNAFLDNVNANPNLINCTASSPSGGECNPTEYNSWKQVDNTSGSGVVPEWYLWENPVFCSGTSTTHRQVHRPHRYREPGLRRSDRLRCSRLPRPYRLPGLVAGPHSGERVSLAGLVEQL